MASHNNFKKDKCWSCEYFSGKREYKKGTFLGDSVYTDVKGKCSNNRSTDCNHEIFEDSWCSEYQKWGVLQSALAVEEQKKESQRIISELNKQQQEAEATSHPSRTLSPQERAELDARWEEYEKQEKIRAKQKAISTQQAKINKIEKSPIIAAIISGIISLIAFLLGWIPYWYFDRLLTTTREKILWYEKMGYDPNSDTIVFLYNQGLQAKQSRDSVLWIPFVILGIGIVATVTIVILVNKTKHKRLIKARKELEELKK